MRINFRQGIINYPRTGTVQSFLARTGNFVTLQADNGVIDVTIAHGDTDYLVTEVVTVNDAWGPITPNTDTWLYWDINRQTAARTFGITELQPVLSGSRPTTPADGQHWFDTLAKKMYVAQSGVWREVIRVFAGVVNNSTFTPMGSGFPLAPYAGTQVGISGFTIGAGRILADGVGNPIRKVSGQFFTAEDDFFINGSPTNAVRIESNIMILTADENTARHQIVKLTSNGKALLANYNDTGSVILAVTTEDILTNDAGTAILQGVITNPDWAWSTVNAPLWVSAAGILVDVDPHITDAVTYPVSKNPIARVISSDTIIFDQGLGGKGDKGDPGGGANTLDELTDVTLTSPANTEVLTYNGSEWVNLAPAAGVEALDDLSDVIITTPANTEVLTYNGSEWVNLPAAGGGGLEFFTETRDTSVGASHVFTATGAEARIEAALIPKGDGGISASDQSLTPLRGIKSVDWQMSRTVSNQIAAGNYTVIGGGADNIISATTTHSVIAGGLENVFSGISSRSFIGSGQDNNIIDATNCVIGGGDTNLIQNATRAFVGGGESHILNGNYATIGGGLANSIVGTHGSIVGGANNRISTSSTYGSIIGGQSNVIDDGNSWAVIAGGTNNQVASDYSDNNYTVIAGGGNNIIQGGARYGFIGGGNSNNMDGSFTGVVGGGEANISSFSNYSVIGGGSANTVTSSDYTTIGGGTSNSIDSQYGTISGGFDNTIPVQSQYGVVGGGLRNTASGTGSTVPGGIDANTRGVYGRMSYSAGRIVAQGDCQTSHFQGRTTTTGATPTVLTADLSAASATNVLALPDNSVYGVTTTILARSAAGDVKRWKVEAVAKRGVGAATTTIHGVASTTIYEDAGATTWTAVVSADTTNGAVIVTVTGVAATTIRWIARFDTEELVM